MLFFNNFSFRGDFFTRARRALGKPGNGHIGVPIIRYVVGMRTLGYLGIGFGIKEAQRIGHRKSRQDYDYENHYIFKPVFRAHRTLIDDSRIVTGSCSPIDITIKVRNLSKELPPLSCDDSLRDIGYWLSYDILIRFPGADADRFFYIGDKYFAIAVVAGSCLFTDY